MGFGEEGCTGRSGSRLKDLLVLMACSSVQKLQPEYMRQLTEADIDYHVEHLGPRANENGGGTFSHKVDSFRRLSKLFCEYEKLVFTCAWDVLFYGTKKEVLGKIPDQGVLLGAERNCYPDASIAHLCKGDVPWRFVNGGLTAGTPESILAWLDGIEQHLQYHPSEVDQLSLNLMRAENSPLTMIDARTELFYCLHLEGGELDFENGLPVNKLCGTHPNWLHFNGRHPHEPAMELRERSLR
jgi:hypothetical protein